MVRRERRELDLREDGETRVTIGVGVRMEVRRGRGPGRGRATFEARREREGRSREPGSNPRKRFGRNAREPLAFVS